MAHEWMDLAACLGADGEAFFPVGVGGPAHEQTKYARERWCNDCPVSGDCLDFALDRRLGDGIWGGTTPDERTALKRRASRARARTSDAAPVSRAARKAGQVDAAAARRLIEDSGLTLGQISRRCDVNRESLSQIRRGIQTVIREETFVRIRDGLAGLGVTS